jgi:hypothetical protein
LFLGKIKKNNHNIGRYNIGRNAIEGKQSVGNGGLGNAVGVEGGKRNGDEEHLNVQKTKETIEVNGGGFGKMRRSQNW